MVRILRSFVGADVSRFVRENIGTVSLTLPLINYLRSLLFRMETFASIGQSL